MFNFIFSKNQVYIDKFYLYQYNDENIRIVHQKYCRKKGFENIQKNSYIPQTEPEEVERISLSRTRRNIRELALSNNFEYFATLTINSKNCDRFSLTECQNLLRLKLKKLKRKDSDFAYLFITEKHKNGAFHFHGLIKGVDDFYINENGYFSHKLFDEIGFNSFSKIHDYTKTCNYILKYITKDCIKNEHGTVYISSRGLKKADRYEIKPLSIDWSYKNDFCQIKDINISELSQTEILNLQNIDEKTFLPHFSHNFD